MVFSCIWCMSYAIWLLTICPDLKSAIDTRAKLLIVSCYNDILSVLQTEMRIKPFMINLILPIGILGQVWYLIVSIPDLCNLTYFNKLSHPLRPVLLKHGIVFEQTLFYSLYSLIWYAILPILKDKFWSLSNPQTQYGIFACDASLYAI